MTHESNSEPSRNKSRKRRLRALALLLAACSVVSLCAAVYGLMPHADDGFGGNLLITDVDLGEVEAMPHESGREVKVHPIVVEFRNLGDGRISILGMESGCYPGGCCRFDFEGPLQISPGATVHVTGEVKASTGPFNMPLKVHYDAEGMQTTVFHIRGIGIPAPPTP